MANYRYESPWNFGEHRRAHQAISAITLRHRPSMRAFRILFVPLMLALVFVPRWLSGTLEFNVAFVVALMPWLFIGVVWLVMLWWGESYLAARRTRRLDPSVNGLLVRTLSTEGFQVDGTGSRVNLQWQGVHSVVETEEFFLIFFNKLCGYYVPKRLIPAAELTGVRELLRDHLGERATLQPTIANRAA